MAAPLPPLVERSQQLAELAALVARVGAQHVGEIAFIGGEAGAGKTSLVWEFAARTAARVLVGGSEPLRTPRAHGPLLDIAAELGGELHQLVERGATQSELVTALEREVSGGPPIVLVFEDLHWADEATLDLLRIVARRLRRLPVLILATYREDQLSRTHPLRVLLGELATERRVHRMSLPLLSESGVAELARGDAVDVRRLHELTGGNPFFVTEVLAAGTHEAIPDTVRDAVLARVARLPGLGRHLLDAVAVVPARAELWLLEAIAPLARGSLETCLASGALLADRESVKFRHEIARASVEDALPPDVALAMHHRALAALVAHEPAVDPARIVHHANAVGDAATVLTYAPAAAERASQLRAHREAAAHLESALGYASQLSRRRRAELLERHAYECYLTTQMDKATTSHRLALAEHVASGDRLRQGDSHRWLSRIVWFLGDRSTAEEEARLAIEILEALPLSSELAMAYSNMGQLRMLADDAVGARDWSGRAVALAEEIGNQEILAHALNNAGTADMLVGAPEGSARLERSLRIAQTHGLEEHVARAFTNLASTAVNVHDLRSGMRWIDAGLAYCQDHDLDSWRLYITGWRAQAHLDRGEWDLAERDASEVLGHPGVAPPSLITPLSVLGRLRARRGEPGVWEVLDEALALARGADELQRLVPTAVARAEARILEGSEQAVETETHDVVAKARREGVIATIGELLVFRRRAGIPTDGPSPAPTSPWTMELDGRVAEAAVAWDQLGLPYEAAWARVVGREETGARAGLVELRAMGVPAAADAAARVLRQRGLTGLARGPRAATARTPYGLTPRQLEVLGLLVAGLRNSEIAERMVVSERTVDHHVSAVLQKLGVQSRTQAVVEAERQGIVPVA